MGLSRLLRACFAEPLSLQIRLGLCGHASSLPNGFRGEGDACRTRAREAWLPLAAGLRAGDLCLGGPRRPGDPSLHLHPRFAVPHTPGRGGMGRLPPGSARAQVARAQVAGGLDWPGAGAAGVPAVAGAPALAGMRAAAREPWPPGRFGAAIGLCLPLISAPSHSASWQLPSTDSLNKRVPLIIYRLLCYRNCYRLI